MLALVHRRACLTDMALVTETGIVPLHAGRVYHTSAERAGMVMVFMPDGGRFLVPADWFTVSVTVLSRREQD